MAPALAVAAVVIVFDSGYPIFFTQTRVGRNGRPFLLLKFRTMYADSGGTLLSLHRDPRITRLGHFLRASKVDELPQLFNILCGSMSFIGPRPEVPLFVDRSHPIWRRILSVRPGLFDPAYLAWRNEARILSASADPSGEYPPRGAAPKNSPSASPIWNTERFGPTCIFSSKPRCPSLKLDLQNSGCDRSFSLQQIARKAGGSI